MNKKHRLNDSKVFCMAPWVSINNNPNGNILPCCVSKFHEPFGNLNNDSIENIWNNEKYKELRKNMLEEKKTSTCERCYKEEEWETFSYRQYWNSKFGNKYDDLVEKTTADGSLDEMKLYRWDFRFNNLCNLSCVMCGPELSSSWVELSKKMDPYSKKHKIYSSRDKTEQFLNTIKSQSELVEDVYFAGGEPLMHSEQYTIMEELDKQNKIDKVFFTYSTNLTNLYYKNYNIVDYLEKMTECKILISLDEIDIDRLYYIRYPSNIDDIVKNIRIINKHLTSVKKHWSITPTWNILNIHRIKEIIEFFYINDLLPAAYYSSVTWDIDMCNIVLMVPKHLSISIASEEWKKVIHTKLNEFEEWYESVMIPLKNENVRPIAQRILKGNMEKFRKALNEPNDTIGYKNWFQRLDETRNTNFIKTFPELDWYLR